MSQPLLMLAVGMSSVLLGQIAGVPPTAPPTQGCSWQCYLDRYPDLQSELGATNTAAAQRHYKDAGQSEGRDCKCQAATCTTLPSTAIPTAPPTVSTIRVHTCDVVNAGTDSRVYMSLDSGSTWHNLDNAGNDRERNQWDEYTLPGIASSIDLKIDGSDAWCLNKMVVNEVEVAIGLPQWFDISCAAGDGVVPCNVSALLTVQSCDWQCYVDRYKLLQSVFRNNTDAARLHYHQGGRGKGEDCTCPIPCTASEDCLSAGFSRHECDNGLCKVTTYILNQSGATCWSAAGNRVTIGTVTSIQECAEKTLANPQCANAFEVDAANHWCGCGRIDTANAECLESIAIKHKTSNVYRAISPSVCDADDPSRRRSRDYDCATVHSSGFCSGSSAIFAELRGTCQTTCHEAVGCQASTEAPAEAYNLDCYVDRYANLRNAFGATNAAVSQIHSQNDDKSEGRESTCQTQYSNASSRDVTAVVLVVLSMRADRTETIMAYQQWFPFIVYMEFIRDRSGHSRTETISECNSSLYLKCFADIGFYHVGCLSQLLLKVLPAVRPCAQGVIAMHMDFWIQPYRFKDELMDRIWQLDKGLTPSSFSLPKGVEAYNAHEYNETIGPVCCERITPNCGRWHWHSDSQKKGLSAAQKALAVYAPNSSEPVRVCGGWSDMFYLPRAVWKDFSDLVKLYFHDTFHEVAIPSIIDFLVRFKGARREMISCWGGCCATAANILEMSEYKCGHRVDLAKPVSREALTKIIARRARSV